MNLINTVIKGLLDDYGVRSVLYETYRQTIDKQEQFVSEEQFWEAINQIKKGYVSK